MSGTWEAVSRNAVEIHRAENLRRRVEAGEKLRVKLGFDPTAPDLHLGHTVVLRKLRAFQDLGHTAVIIIGDFTARIGDPTGRSETRPPLSPEEVDRNAETYLDQLFLVVRREGAEIRRQSEWFDGMRLAEVISLMGRATVAALLQREDFKNRMEDSRAIGLHEFLYPLLQGYDSVAVKADVELGGTDQLFNLLFAREVQRAHGQDPEDVMVHPILEGTDGVQKMSKSLANYIGVSEPPAEIYGKTMSLPDGLITRFFRYATSVEGEEVDAMERSLAAREVNPRDLKDRLARWFVTEFHSADAATAAADEFRRRFREHQLPETIEEIRFAAGTRLLEALVAGGLCASNGEARRLLEQGGVRVNGAKAADPTYVVVDGDLLQAGKRRHATARVD